MLVPLFAEALGVPDLLCEDCLERPCALNLGICIPCYRRTTTMVSRLRKLAVETPWGDAQKQLLEHYVARLPLKGVASRLGVSTTTVKVCCHGLGLDVATLRREAGTRSLLRLSQDTGYSKGQLLRAGRMLKQRWASTQGHRLIDAHQQSALMHYLANLPTPYVSRRGRKTERWSKLFDRCVVCATSGNAVSQRHHSRGRCVGCHNAETTRGRRAAHQSKEAARLDQG